MATPITTNTSIPSDAAIVKRILDERNHDLWGFVIYRCTYDDNAAWDQFKNIVTTRARKEIQRSDKPEILETFEWKFFDDRETFDNATAAFLREHFKEWKSNNWQREQPRATYDYAARYYCFIRVDQEALDSVLNAPAGADARPGNCGWVHFVDASWRPALDDVDSDTEEMDMPDLDFEPTEGCREEDVGWMKLPVFNIGTYLYTLFDTNEIWPALYRRPPEMCLI